MRWVASALALILVVAVMARAAPPGDKPRIDKPAPRPTMLLAGETGEEWPMSLPDAIRIALDNSEIVCVVYGRLPQATVTDQDRRDPGVFLSYHPYYEAPNCWEPAVKKAPIAGPLMIHRVNADTPLRRFRADVMALVRSLEQQYWVVSAQRVRVGCAERVVKTGADVLRKEQDELLVSHGSVVDIAEAAQRLEQFQKDLSTQTAKLADADRRLRILLGLPKSDGRHIVTVTRPIDQPYDCDPRDGCPATDAVYRQYQTAKQHRIEAARRLEAQKAYYDEGRITIDRYFDFISQNADAVAAEADRASEYNTAISALGEAKGTLLADRFILVIDQPLRMPKNWVDGPEKPVESVKKASFEVP